MFPRSRAAALALAAAMFLCPMAARAGCAPDPLPDTCARPPAEASVRPAARHERALSGGSAVSAAVQVGDVLPRGRYSILLDAGYYGLPPVSDGWVYMRVGPDCFRVDWRTHRVLERITDRVAANF